MTRRKAFPRFSRKLHAKDTVAPSRNGSKAEKLSAKTRRRKHSAIANVSETTSDSQPHDVYTFQPPMLLPSPGSASSPDATDSAIALENDDDRREVRAGDKEHRNTEEAGNQTPVIICEIQEDTLLNILCAIQDVEVAKQAIKVLLQRTATSAKSGDEFGIQYLRSFISRLSEMSIDQSWLAKVIDLIQHDLERVCDRAVCQVRSLGKSPLTGNDALNDTETVALNESHRASDVDAALVQAPSTPEANSDNMMSGALPVSNEAEHEDTIMTFPEDEVDPNATLDDAPIHQNEAEHEHIKVAPIEIKPKKQKKKKQTQRSSPLAATMQDNIDKGSMTARNASPPWTPNNGTSSFYVACAPMNTNLDLFVRSAVDAHCFASDEAPAIIAAYTREVRRAWTTLQPEQRAAWVKLFNSLPEAESLSVRGQRLLESQGLLAKFVPDA